MARPEATKDIVASTTMTEPTTRVENDPLMSFPDVPKSAPSPEQQQHRQRKTPGKDEEDTLASMYELAGADKAAFKNV